MREGLNPAGTDLVHTFNYRPSCAHAMLQPRLLQTLQECRHFLEELLLMEPLEAGIAYHLS